MSCKDITFQPLTWMNDGEQYAFRKIVCAANKYILTSGEELVIPCIRHSNPVLSQQLKVLRDAGLLTKLHCAPSNQGFVDQYGNWWNREEAFIIAKAAGQIDYERNGHDHELFSEGLY